jgi:hypothetical protein
MAMNSSHVTTGKAVKNVKSLLFIASLLNTIRYSLKVLPSDLVNRSRFLTQPVLLTSFYSRPKRLEFVHIPKTGGTVIEAMAAKRGIHWTICHFLPSSEVAVMSMNIIQCPERDDGEYSKWKRVKRFHDIVWWHLPPSYFFNYAEILPSNPYSGADMFAVVRNPYDRLISEYYYQQSWLVSADKRRQTQDVRYFNEWIRTKVESYAHFSCQRSAKSDLFQSTNATKSYLSFDGHLISQYDYIFDGSTRATSVANKIVTNVLRFENLTEEYNELMKEYGLGDLTPLPREHVRKSLPKFLGLFNLTLDNLHLIERVYRQDFEEFGYEMRSSSIPSEILRRNAQLVRCKANMLLGSKEILQVQYQVRRESNDGDGMVNR